MQACVRVCLCAWAAIRLCLHRYAWMWGYAALARPGRIMPHVEHILHQEEDTVVNGLALLQP